MRLITALRLKETPRLAFVGAGGKTSAIFHLARQLIEPDQDNLSFQTVMVISTTNLATNQLMVADHHQIIESASQIETLDSNLPRGVLLLTGPYQKGERVFGLTAENTNRVFELVEKWDIPLLVAADGPCECQFKAQGSHEPKIPQFVDHVVVVAGLSAIGQPLSPEWFQHLDWIARITNLSMNEPITARSLQLLLTNPEGGLKNIPAHARRIILLNQADSLKTQSEANRLSIELLRAYHAAVIAELPPNCASDALERKPISFPEDTAVHAVHEPVAGIILAAGEAKRMQQPKQILPFLGEPMIRHPVKAALASGLSPVIVVTGAYHNEVRHAVQGLPVTLTHNIDWQSGQSFSISAGIKKLPTEIGSVIFLLADQPFVSSMLIIKLIELHAKSLSPIVAPLINEERGNPVLFDRDTFVDLLKLEGDVGGRALFAKYPINWLPWNDPRISIDIDTPKEYQQLLQSQEHKDFLDPSSILH